MRQMDNQVVNYRPRPPTAAVMRVLPSDQEERMQGDRLSNSTTIQALLPGLRVSAWKLVKGSALAPDDLVQAALMTALRDCWLAVCQEDKRRERFLALIRTAASVP